MNVIAYDRSWRHAFGSTAVPGLAAKPIVDIGYGYVAGQPPVLVATLNPPTVHLNKEQSIGNPYSSTASVRARQRRT